MTQNSNKQVGVLTYHNGPNFGGFMQAWHLVNAIRGMGYQSCAVNYLHADHQESNRIHIPLRNLNSLKARIFWQLKKRGFRDIEKAICKHPFTSDPEQVPWNSFAAMVVGSDIVWDYHNPAFGHDPAYFKGLPGQRDMPHVAYAASCGPASPEGPFPAYVRNGLPSFQAIGVRDDATARLVRNAAGLDSTLVVDPTWLGDDPELEWSGRPKGQYLFAYGGRFDESFGPVLRDYCHARGWKLVSALTSCHWADKMYRSLTPFQWVDLFRNAEATAIVGTLHGTLFSIKYGRPFILQNSTAIAPKIVQALERTGQTFRVREPGTITRGDLDILDAEAYPPPQVPADWLADSRAFLSGSLVAATA